MNKYYKAIVKLNMNTTDVKEFVEANKIESNKPLSVVLTERHKSLRIDNEINPNFKWSNKFDSLILNRIGTWTEFEVVLMGKELSPTEVEDIKRLATALS